MKQVSKKGSGNGHSLDQNRRGFPDRQHLVKQQGEISHFVIADNTVAKAVGNANVVEVKVQLSDTSLVSVPVTSFDKSSGILR